MARLFAEPRANHPCDCFIRVTYELYPTTIIIDCLLERYKRHLIHLERVREKQMMNLQSGTPFETVTLTTIGRERKLFFDIIEEGTINHK